MDIHPVTDPDDLPRKVDAIRDVLANIREIGARRREHRRDMDVSDAAMRIAVGFARFLPPDSPLPSDEFLIELATRVLDGYDGTTRMPRKVIRNDDDRDSRDNPCECQTGPHEACPKHGIAASNARENRYWQRVGGHD